MERGDPTEILSRGVHESGQLVSGRYRLERLIGYGTAADVWRARDERRDRLVMLKILRAREDARAHELFLTRARLLDGLTDPFILPVYGIQDSLGLTFIASEYVEGGSLSEIAAARGPLAAREVAEILLQAARGVETLRRRGLADLDLRPTDLLLSSDGRVRLIDLGDPGATARPADSVAALAVIARELLRGRDLTARVSRMLRGVLDPDASRRYAGPRSFAMAFTIAVLVDEEFAWMRSLNAALRARTRSVRRRLEQRWRALPAADRLSARTVVGATVVGAIVAAALLAALVVPRSDPVVADDVRPVLAPLARATFELPPLSAYAARFESQGAYPTASPGDRVEWIVALRNTGSAGWYRGIAGAQASLVLADGTVAAIQTTPYVGPGQVGWFVARFRAPTGPGPHIVGLRPQIDGAGLLPDLGIYAVVTVTKADSGPIVRH